MARYGKRRITGPCKNEQKVARGMRAANMARMAGTLRERFPTVQRLAIQLDFINPQQQPFDRQKRVFSPSDSCDFAVGCPGRCGSGSFDLAGKLKAVIEARESVSESSAVCPVPLYAGASQLCGFQLKCRIEVAYHPEKADAPKPGEAPALPEKPAPQP